MRAQGFFRLVPLLVLLIMLSGAVGAVTLVGAGAQGDGFHSQVHAARTEQLAQARALYVGHEAVTQFDDIPDWARNAASEKDVLQLRCSTGQYISNGLCCLQVRQYAGGDSEAIPCGDPYDTGPYGWVPPECIWWTDDFQGDPVDYWNRNNWHFSHFKHVCGDKIYFDYSKVDCLKEALESHNDNYDAFSMKFCYTPFWKDVWDVDVIWAYYRDAMEELEAAYPNKTFIWWTKPLKTANAWEGTECQDFQRFNQLVREYCEANDKILYDMADLESHDESGNPCYSYSGCESMCYDCHWNPEEGGGYPSECKHRLAKGYWVLMAKIAGWTPACDLPGDLNCDCIVDMADIMLVASRWSTSVGDDDYNQAYDLDGDGDIDIVDIMLVAVHWGETCEG